MQDMLVSMGAMVTSTSKEGQPSTSGLSPSKALAMVMLILMILAIFQTHRRAMVTHDFLVIDDTDEMMEEDL